MSDSKNQLCQKTNSYTVCQNVSKYLNYNLIASLTIEARAHKEGTGPQLSMNHLIGCYSIRLGSKTLHMFSGTKYVDAW